MARADGTGMDLSRFDLLARRQFGVVSFDQTDLNRRSWDRALAAGSLIGLHPGVARLVGTVPDERQQIKAATLAEPRSVASHRSAAVLWGLVAPRPEVDVIVHLTGLSDSTTRQLSGVAWHRPRDRVDIRPVTRHGIGCTPPLRTLLDLGITDPELVHEAVGEALSTGLLTIDGIDAGLRRHSSPGRHGVTALRSALDDWAIDARPADSVLETAFVDLCRRHALPRPQFHERLEGWEVDFRFPGSPIVVECDGWTTHGRRRHQFELDRRKDDDLRAAGWIVARFSYRAITMRPADTARRLRRLLDRWTHLAVPDAPCDPAA